jgi:AGZA family xanthine/uracil permease-like MFS transporter
VESGGRTGLTAVVTGICFLLALFLAPLVEMVSSCNSVTAPALVVVGAMMTRNVSKIDWEDFSEAIPAFITLLCIPLSYSIADGITLGLVSCAALKIFSGKLKDLSWFTMALALILALYMLFIRR